MAVLSSSSSPGDGDGGFEEELTPELSSEVATRATASPTLLDRVRGMTSGLDGLLSTSPRFRSTSTPPVIAPPTPEQRPKSAHGYRSKEEEGRRYSHRLLERVNQRISGGRNNSEASSSSSGGGDMATPEGRAASQSQSQSPSSSSSHILKGAGGRLTQGGRITKNRHSQRVPAASTGRKTMALDSGSSRGGGGLGGTSTTATGSGDSANVDTMMGGMDVATGDDTTSSTAARAAPTPELAPAAVLDPASFPCISSASTSTSTSSPSLALDNSSSLLGASSTSLPPQLASPGTDSSANRPEYTSRSDSSSSSLAASSYSDSSSRPVVSSTVSATSIPPYDYQDLPSSATSSKPSLHGHSQSLGSTTAAGAAMALDDDPVLTFWGPDPVPLPTRFARIKQHLIAGHEAAIEASWARLIYALRAEVEHIEGLGAHLIPSIEFSDIHNPAQTTRFGHDLRRYGVGVVRRAVPKPDADDMVNSTLRYLENRGGKHDLKPVEQDPTCFDFFWTPAQIRARAHPAVLSAQRFMMGLWETSPNVNLVTRLPIAYADRLRIHGTAGEQILLRDSNRNGEPEKQTLEIPVATSMEQAPQSADDWVIALQSSAGIIAQVDNGSLERWEPDGYGRTGTYSRVFRGEWESYDPWECASRVSSTIDLYNGYGSCTIFRMFQAVVALSTIEPGMIRLLPSPKLATAYFLLRPFFSAKTPMPEVRTGPDWDAYLDPSNWKLDRSPDTIIHGAVPGHAQRITERWHPHLHLRSSMITLPTLQPGDYIFWHPDLAYHISSHANHGLRTPVHGPDDVRMLVYVPAAPLTQTNALYLARQRKAFQRGHPGPDFDSNGRGFNIEDPATKPGEKDIEEVGGAAGLQAMGLAPWDASSRDGTQVNGDKGVPRGEAEIVELSNDILFPDRPMPGL